MYEGVNYEFPHFALGETAMIGHPSAFIIHNSAFIILPSNSYRHALRAQVLFQAADGVRLVMKN